MGCSELHKTARTAEKRYASTQSMPREFKSFGSTERSLLSKGHGEPSYSEIYAEPENFLEIEVHNPKTHIPNGMDSKGMFTDYEIICRTNLPSFHKRVSKVRRRYSDFEFFRKCLIKEISMLNHPKVMVPHLPGKILLSNRFSNEVIEERRQGLNTWMQSVAGHPLLQSGSKVLVRFIEAEKFVG
ncbi:CCN_G0052030.mRNA.1.CDS.1 [Saccharomyces cerevisiae]|nr:HLJ1_G0041120.mRNA.1.CDS.1 [Saccharomyces cerevisiae]CAI4802759.1 CCN_G0052030.mRNA.1.CDS.1 [Saccharomyces cerevisiae]CAI7468602.1 CCN_G0052030.mRNA.1.CDS.1 [Saccharomyces cerevisiae]